MTRHDHSTRGPPLSRFGVAREGARLRPLGAQTIPDGHAHDNPRRLVGVRRRHRLGQSHCETPGPNQTIVHQSLAPVGDTSWVQRLNATTRRPKTSLPINDSAPMISTTAPANGATVSDLR